MGLEVGFLATGLVVLAVAALGFLAGYTLRARRRLVVITVDGVSMTPTYQPGDRLIVRRRPGRQARVGEVVVVERPERSTGWDFLPMPGPHLAGRRWLVKRVAAVAGDPVPEVVRRRLLLPPDARVAAGEIVVLGEHVNSEDSKLWGGFPADRVLGVVVRKL